MRRKILFLMMNLFTYGTLQFPQVVKRLTDKNFNTISAILAGYERVLVTGTDYPAIRKKPDSEVKGTLLVDIDHESMNRFIQFEGDEYEMKKVVVDANGENVEAIVFTWKGDPEMLDEKDWDQKGFESDSLHFYS